MKRLLLTLMAATLCTECFAINTARISDFPLTHFLGSNDLFIVAIPSTSNRSLKASDLLDLAWQYSSNAITLQSNVTVIQSNITVGATNSVAIQDGFMMSSVSQATNYWFDFGQTNSAGSKLIYCTLRASTNVNILGVTNCNVWSILSANIMASNANRTITVPTNVFHYPYFNTNNWALSGTRYSTVLTNGNELRMTIQSNSVISTTWATFGQ